MWGPSNFNVVFFVTGIFDWPITKKKEKVLDSPKIDIRNMWWTYWELGEHAGNSLGMWWEHCENFMGTHWEQQKSNTTALPQKKKNLSPQVHAASHHWLQEIISSNCVLCRFWGRLMAGAWTYLFRNWGYLFILFYVN